MLLILLMFFNIPTIADVAIAADIYACAVYAIDNAAGCTSYAAGDGCTVCCCCCVHFYY